jgi:hypothetical protein
MSSWPQFINPKEFDNPNKIHPKVIEFAAETREWLKRPIYLTYTTNGTVRHRNGDAVHPQGTSHSHFSLHKWGIDHSASKRARQLIPNERSLGRAIDCDFNVSTVAELWEQYLEINKLNLWTGIGVYPMWNNKGFHLDVRDSEHPGYRQHWFRANGLMYELTWANFKHFFGRQL